MFTTGWTAASAAQFEYGTISLVESRVAVAGESFKELIVRADTNAGNEFLCRERTEDTPTSRSEPMWHACIRRLIEVTPNSSPSDVPATAVYFEPIVLSLFGKVGWEVYDVSKSVLELPTTYAETTLFRVKREVD
jgi:hypothetical protein